MTAGKCVSSPSLIFLCVRPEGSCNFADVDRRIHWIGVRCCKELCNSPDEADLMHIGLVFTFAAFTVLLRR
jgi:hypothetical protein